MRLNFSGKRLFFSFMSAGLLASCASSQADDVQARQQVAVRAPDGAVTVPIGSPRRSDTTMSTPPSDPGFSRAPAGLDSRLFDLWRSFPGQTGIAVQRIDGNWALSRRGDDLFPQQSVSKLWVTMSVLDAVDRGKISLEQNVHIGPEDLVVFHQPLASRVKSEGSFDLTVDKLIQLAITTSDNLANDSLLRTVGGPNAVRDFIAKKKLGTIRFGPGERLLQSGTAGLTWSENYATGRAFQTARAQLPAAKRKAAFDAYVANPVDGASPLAIAHALTELARGELLSPESTKYLLETLSHTRSGPKRLKAGLPDGWSFLHKTGTGQDYAGMTAGYNDVGIATAPDGTRYAIVVMLANTTASVPARMRLMQAVSAAVAEYHGK